MNVHKECADTPLGKDIVNDHFPGGVSFYSRGVIMIGHHNEVID